jgi:hypothetical protein
MIKRIAGAVLLLALWLVLRYLDQKHPLLPRLIKNQSFDRSRLPSRSRRSIKRSDRVWAIVIPLRTERNMSWIFGSLMGSMWMGYVLALNLDGLLGRSTHAYALTPWFLAGAMVFTASSGFLAAYWTGSGGTAMGVAFWSGVISAAITIVTVIVINTLFHDVMMQDSSTIRAFIRAVHHAPTNTELSDFIWTDALGGCVMQLWIGPLLGLVIGGPGALVGKIVRNSLVRMRFA